MNISIPEAVSEAVLNQANKEISAALGRDTSPLADLVDTARICVATSKADPFGEFADVRPITIRNAGLVLREATKRLEAARLTHKSASEAVQETNRAYGEAIEAHRKAEHLLMISALQPNGGEA